MAPRIASVPRAVRASSAAPTRARRNLSLIIKPTTSALSSSARRCRAKFRRYFPNGFQDETYRDLERDYKWKAHMRWEDALRKDDFRALLKAGEFAAIAAQAVAIESRTNLLFSFEKMALRDAVKSPAGARVFAKGLFEFLHRNGTVEERFDAWCQVLAELPRRQTRVLTWPVATVFGFIAQPSQHFFLKPNVTRRAFEAYGLPLAYRSRPNGETYRELLKLTRNVKRDLSAMHPRDMIDIQSFLWVQGSDEYPD